MTPAPARRPSIPQRHHWRLATVLPSLALLLAGCGGGGGGGGSPADPAAFTGSWSLTIQPDVSGSCAQRTTASRSYRIEITQIGAQVSIADATGLQLDGSLANSGTTGLTLTGRYPFDAGFAAVSAMELRLEGSDLLVGEAPWNQTVAGMPCSGTDTFRATRIPPLEDLAGTWDLNETVLDSSCTLTSPRFRDTWTISQNGDRVSVSRVGSGSIAAGRIESNGRLILDFDFVDPNVGRIVETFFIDFLTDRSPPGLTAVSEWSYPGCSGRSEHAGLRTAR